MANDQSHNFPKWKNVKRNFAKKKSVDDGNGLD